MTRIDSPTGLSEDESLMLEHQLCFPLYSAANSVIRAYRPLLNELDLTYVQYLVMLVLWQNDAINVKTLGEKLNLDSGTLTPLLKRLETKGLVTRKRGTDERVRVLHLTEKGEALKSTAAKVPTTMVSRFGLELDELVQLKTLCEKVVKALP